MEIAAPVVSATARAVNFTNEGGIDGTIRLLKNIAGLWLLQECRRSWQRQGHEYSWDELMALASGAPAFASIINPDAHDFLNPDDMPSAIQHYCQRNGITVPGIITLGNIWRGMSSRASISPAQSRVWQSSIWVVEALVYSATATPDIQ